jgi:tRNA pseudouridine38-40 synthase
MKNIKIILSYDGTNYLGWQKTKTGPSIEEELEKACFILLKQKFLFQAASRTDKNVHAKKQILNFFIDKEIDLNLLKYKLNCLLPKDIRILQLKEVDKNFHPTLDCIKKHYRYYICQDPFQYPHKRFYSWHIPHPLNIDKMKKASKILIGKHNFLAFSNRKEKNPIREIYEISIEKKDNQIIIDIIGNSFLYKMIRNIVGCLVFIGKEKIIPCHIKKILKSQNRKKIFVTASSHGLFLYDIFY